eukprot:CAMPEP_0180211366 /NCGR_PEP_ID=MMETSP0987-20121128/12771_1 /TAXON_ID=697907 /ORGANISM="non described non described, Strain CCMP2293" /LENGTH=86 /DNA_ID=CAMNT_0022168647 /DNA_START=633 /DNA_END=893 /DNA_ORIENTATION=-
MPTAGTVKVADCPACGYGGGTWQVTEKAGGRAFMSGALGPPGVALAPPVMGFAQSEQNLEESACCRPHFVQNTIFDRCSFCGFFRI